MRKKSLLGQSAVGFHKVVYREWGPERSERTLLCLHGLTRNGRDFERLAGVLAGDGWRVVAPDTVGRGDSDRARQASVYGYPQYLADMTALVARLEIERLDWLGTSMGGLVGMMMAAAAGSPIRRLVVNDVGPFVPKASLERIAGYVGQPVSLDDRKAAEAYVRETYASFGRRLEDVDWRLLTDISFRQDAEGRYVLNYDPKIAAAFAPEQIRDVDLWPVWDAIAQPTLVLRGAESDLLLAETAAEMRQRGPKADLVAFEACGHAPSLLESQQIQAVRDWLNAGH